VVRAKGRDSRGSLAAVILGLLILGNVSPLAARSDAAPRTMSDAGVEVPPVLRQAAFAAAYDRFGVVAHAFGPVGPQRWRYTNTLEAFQENYQRGFRVFEVDLVRLADGTVFAAHNGLEARYGLSKSFRDATRADIEGVKYGGRYTALDGAALVELLRDHRGAFFIADAKWDAVEIFRTMVDHAGGDPWVVDRIVPHVADQAELDAFRAVWPLRNYVLALYRTQWRSEMSDSEAVEFVRRNGTPAVMMWRKTYDPSLSLAQNHIERRRFSERFRDDLWAAGAIVYVHTVNTRADAARFKQMRVGFYSDGPFPLLDP